MHGDEPPSGSAGDPSAREAAALYRRAERYRRMARSIPDRQAQEALCGLATEAEAKAARLRGQGEAADSQPAPAERVEAGPETQADCTPPRTDSGSDGRPA